MKLQYQLAYTRQGLYLYILIMALLFVLMVVVPQILKKPGLTAVMERLSGKAYICGIALIIAGVAAGHLDYYDVSMNIYTAALYVLGPGIMLIHCYRKEYSRKTLFQVCAIACWLLIWYVGALKSDVTIKEYISFKHMGFAVVSANAFAWIVKVIIELKKTTSYSAILSGLRRYLIYLPAVIIAGVVSLMMVKLPFIWDASDYLSGLLKSVRWEFTLGNLADSLRVAGHISAGYVLLLEPGVWLFSDTIIGIHVVQFVILVITVIFFGETIRKEFPEINPPEISVISLLFLLIPSVLGLSSGLNLDFGMLCLMIWFIYAFANELEIFQVVFGIMFCCTKEPAVILYAGIALGIYICHLTKAGKKWPGRIFTCMKPMEWVYLALPAVYWLMILVLGFNWKAILSKSAMLQLQEKTGRTVAGSGGWSAGGNMLWKGVSPELSGQINCFGYSPMYIKEQFEHAFLMNFEWIICLVIIILAVIYFVRIKKQGTKINSKMIIIPFIGIIIFMLFISLYITHPHYRYVAQVGILLLFVLVSFMTACIKSERIRIAIYSALCVLMCIQTFRCIDPVTMNMGNKVSNGDSFVVNYSYNEYTSETTVISDYSLYNLQCNQYGGLLRKVMETIDRENTLIVVPSSDRNLIYTGFGGAVAVDKRGLYYNENDKLFSTVRLPDYSECYAGVVDDYSGNIEYYHSENASVNDFDNIYFLDLPFAGDTPAETVIDNAGFSVISNEEISYLGGWKLNLIKIK